VQDALESVGGLLQDANPHSMNLVAFIRDGERIWVPYHRSPGSQTDLESPANPSGAYKQCSSNSSDGLININTATQAELEKLPGIGPIIGGNIITHPQNNGSFTCIEDIKKDSGIGSATYGTI
jgi:competence protein ComEA